jgi:hypothetical protein
MSPTNHYHRYTEDVALIELDQRARGITGRSETADFEFSGLRDQDSNLEPTG